MFCGSCLHDNTLARALTRLGVDIQLVPLYTPIRTDEQDVSITRVFYSGISIYLHYRLPWTRFVPGLDYLCNRPWLLRWAASGNIKTSARQLGALTVCMLRGTHGPLRKEVRELTSWLTGPPAPDLVVLTNMLVGGCLPTLKRDVGCKVMVTLQGDDVFLEDLPEPYRSQSLLEIRKLVPLVDGFLTHSQYYADFMAEYFQIPRERIHICPLGIDTEEYQRFLSLSDGDATRASRPPTIGYLARLAPAKGLHVLVDAFIELRRRPGMDRTHLLLAGWLGKDQEEYAEAQFQRLRDAGLSDAFEYLGSVDREGKFDFLRRIDVLSVPTTYRDPKGLFVLEALAAGVPVVQPEHGAFPELLSATGGGVLVPPADPLRLADALQQLLTDETARRALGRAGQETVHRLCNAPSMAQQTLEVFSRVLASKRQSPSAAHSRPSKMKG